MDKLEYLLSIDLNYLVIGIIVILFTLEQILSTQFPFSGRGRHFWHNFLFQILFITINIFWATLTVFIIEWLNQNEIGLFFMIELPLWLKLILGLLILDFAAYCFHRLSHLVPLIWRFHRVHHSDTKMDSSTYFRSHPMEILLWFGTATIIACSLFGLDLLIVGFYLLVLTPFQVIAHSNLRFPTWMDRTFGLIFTTPNLHKLHHDKDQNYTDSNYADIFILWDRIFGTFKYKPVEKVNLGLDEFDNDKKQTFWFLIRSPFIKD
tara:strand:+ start:424 stop:1215 length:792 start_codon:yes stop_codon:yes gene_type:complete